MLPLPTVVGLLGRQAGQILFVVEGPGDRPGTEDLRFIEPGRCEKLLPVSMPKTRAEGFQCLVQSPVVDRRLLLAVQNRLLQDLHIRHDLFREPLGTGWPEREKWQFTTLVAGLFGCRHFGHGGILDLAVMRVIQVQSTRGRSGQDHMA